MISPSMANPAYMSRLDVSGGLARPLLFLAGDFWAIETVALLGALGMGSSPLNMRALAPANRCAGALVPGSLKAKGPHLPTASIGNGRC